jgi:hypothetical protein
MKLILLAVLKIILDLDGLHLDENLDLEDLLLDISLDHLLEKKDLHLEGDPDETLDLEDLDLELEMM